MKTVNLITMSTEAIPGNIHNWISKNEPSRMQIEKMMNEIAGELGQNWTIKYEEFEQPHGKAKIYTYLLNEIKCQVVVERRDLLSF